jgi:hypothetical protein
MLSESGVGQTEKSRQRDGTAGLPSTPTYLMRVGTAVECQLRSLQQAAALLVSRLRYSDKMRFAATTIF